MENVKVRIETLENLVEDLILILGRANNKINTLSIHISHLESQLQQVSQHYLSYQQKFIS